MVNTLQEEVPEELEQLDIQPTVEKILLNEEEASYRYGMSVKWFRNQRQLGKGPPYLKIGRSVRYNLIQCDEYFGIR